MITSRSATCDGVGYRQSHYHYADHRQAIAQSPDLSLLERQTIPSVTFHLLLWDDCRSPGASAPESYNCKHRSSLVLPQGFGRNGNAPGSALRAVGLMAATTSWITFADDDVRWESDHLTALFSALANKRWATTLRTIWSPNGERLGVDRFKSVGDDPGRRVPYEMCDNNCMIFSRELGTSAAVLYRETREYNDDRLMYGFLRMHGGPRGHTDTPTLHQTCPERLVDGFRRFCSPQ